MVKKKFYITTTLPYVNSKPHMGHALEFVQADIIARYHKELLNEDVFFNTGTDEHGLKIYRKAIEEGKTPQQYTDKLLESFQEILQPIVGLDVSYTNFIRTTDIGHKQAAQAFWKLCQENDDIYKKNYKVKYCVGCELNKTDSELVEGKCPLHSNLDVEVIEEENYFFRFSKYQKPLLNFYKKNPNFVLPAARFNEIVSFVEGGLEDFSISRLKEKMPWGVSVPGDDEHVMYVWFDALINYVSTLGWPSDIKFEQFWGSSENRNAIQIAGKDNLRQQSAMWQAMLMSAGLPNSKLIIIHGFITSNGQKMSKSLGNVVDPMEVIKKYGTDALRYFLAREISAFEDGDFTWERFEESYNSGLANGLGNLVSRILKMAVNYDVKFKLSDPLVTKRLSDTDTIFKEYFTSLNSYNVKGALDAIWSAISWADGYIQTTEPFKKIKIQPEEARGDIVKLLNQLNEIAIMLGPVLPETSQKIFKALEDLTLDGIPKLFPRMDN